MDLVLRARPRDIGGFSVRRALPAVQRRLVGPFVFFDHMGPADFPPGQGIDVRPHPHIGLATVTYLFEGAVLHRDSLGSEIAVQPGAVDLMCAGRGVVHSERTPPELRARGHRLHGIQLWLALPASLEDAAPSFVHHAASEIPGTQTGEGVTLRVVLGSAYGLASPVATPTPTLYVEARLPEGARLALPTAAQAEERAFYVVSGSVLWEGASHEEGAMVVLGADREGELVAESEARVMILGGAPMDGPREIWWNFVASDPSRIERAKEAWRAFEAGEEIARFPHVPGDAEELVPLPER